MRKIYFILSICALLWCTQTFGCDFNGDVRGSLDNCFINTDVVAPPQDLEAVDGGGFTTFLLLWVNAISAVLGIAAVGAIVYGSLLFTLSAGEDEKITKAKDIIKWSLLGFIGIITANTFIELVIQILYDI